MKCLHLHESYEIFNTSPEILMINRNSIETNARTNQPIRSQQTLFAYLICKFQAICISHLETVTTTTAVASVTARSEFANIVDDCAEIASIDSSRLIFSNYKYRLLFKV